LLIDAGPDLRRQLLDANISSLSGVLLTHEHYDHVGGLDDIRPLGKTMVYAENRVLKEIKKNLPYCFADNPYPGVPKISLTEISEEPFYIDDVEIRPIRFYHAKLPVLGFRIGNFAYLTDLKTISNDWIEQLRSLDVLVLNALRLAEHISHINLNQALSLAAEIGAKKTYFTHFSHDIGLHAELENTLPYNIFLYYDGLEILI
jgi:phosphoribosyl 1,2-cyclic phosphate phosphodiesterase